MGGKSSPPPAPNYTGAAEQTAASQRVNQFTPYGNLTYSYKGDDARNNPVYESFVNLTPEAQKTLDTQLHVSNQLGNLAEGQIGNVQNQFSHPFDMNSVGQVADKAYGAMTSRLDPQWDARQKQFDAQMANQGIPVGSEAYQNASRDFNNARNDAYQQANLGAIQTMPQTFQLANAAYTQPLNILNAIRSGAEVNNPQFNTNQPGVNYLGAAQLGGQYAGDVYNAQAAQRNAMMSGLMSLGGNLGAAAILA